uniref:Secreted protein n=1 Tax=Steinernema glaseri TaxID=37863 RepID=A0A1I8A3A7_9BILA
MKATMKQILRQCVTTIITTATKKRLSHRPSTTTSANLEIPTIRKAVLVNRSQLQTASVLIVILFSSGAYQCIQ